LAHCETGSAPASEVRTLHQHAGLDGFEPGDVYDKVAKIRPASTDPARVDSHARQPRTLLRP
jgi:hypothetical protein